MAMLQNVVLKVFLKGFLSSNNLLTVIAQVVYYGIDFVDVRMKAWESPFLE